MRREASSSCLYFFWGGGGGGGIAGIPLAMMMTSFYLQPSSITTVVFEERSEGMFAPRCLGVGETSHMAFSDPPLFTAMSRYERVMPHAPHWPRPSGIKANFW